MKKVTLLLLGAISILSCSKEESASNVFVKKDAMKEMTIPSGFNWSSSSKGKISVQIINNAERLSIVDQEVWIIDEKGKRILSTKLANSIAEFYWMAPDTGTDYYIYFPATKHSVKIEKNKTSYSLEVDLSIENRGRYMLDKKSTQKVTYTNLLGNAGFETNSFTTFPWTNVSGLSDNGQWYKYNNRYEWKTELGSKVVKAKEYKSTYFSQLISVTPGDSFALSCDHNGSVELYLLWYNNGNTINYSSYDYFDLNSASLLGAVPSNAIYCEVYAVLRNKGWMDNVNFGTAPAISDADNDGVADENDDFPNDPNYAYLEFYPSAGYQTLAFEDLWPAQGDFDFNDIVISSKIEIFKDANQNILKAEFDVSLDAVGAGLDNGLGILLLNQAKQAYGQNIISSVTGDAIEDPDNENGIIVFNDAYDAQTTYYQNNGVGPSAAAQHFIFTVNFNSNAGSQNFIPDLYTYWTDNRGREVHLSGFSGTSAADLALNNTKEDVNGTYKDINGLPWVIEIVSANKSFQHPIEKVDILAAYPNFQLWAESLGASATDWMDTPADGSVF